MMDEQMQSELRRRVAFEEWRHIGTSGERLFIWQFALYGNEFSGWEAHRIQTVETVGRPPSIQTIWKRPAGGATDELLSVHLYECTSLAAARELLVQMLADFQAPQVARLDKAPAGDVAFGSPEDTFVLFTRANLVLLVRNAERKHIPLSNEVRPFDEYLIRRPDDEGDQRVVPEIERFGLAEEMSPAVGASLPLELRASDPLDRPLWYKFFSSGGEVLVEDGRLTYRPTSAGPQIVTATAVNANRGLVSRRLQFDAK